MTKKNPKAKLDVVIIRGKPDVRNKEKSFYERFTLKVDYSGLTLDDIRFLRDRIHLILNQEVLNREAVLKKKIQQEAKKMRLQKQLGVKKNTKGVVINQKNLN